MSLKYYPYKDNKLVVFGNKIKYGKIMKSLGARWNSRIKSEHGNEGWIIHNMRENEISKLCNVLAAPPPAPEPEQAPVVVATPDNTEFIRSIEKRKKSRKAQKKYHRAISTDEENNSPEDIEEKTLEMYTQFTNPSKFYSPNPQNEEGELPDPNQFHSSHSSASSYRKRKKKSKHKKKQELERIENKIEDLLYQIQKLKRK